MINLKKLIILSFLLILLLFIFFTQTSPGLALTKSRGHLLTSTIDTRVQYEPGSEEYAGLIADFLREGQEIIETKHGKPFPGDFSVIICRSQKSFSEFTATEESYPVRGAVLKGKVYIAPSAFDFYGRDTHRESVLHELSHLHFRQHLGFFRERKIPQWFREGFADYVSGTGGENISQGEAIESILSGNHFEPAHKGKVAGSFKRDLNGLSGPMYHMQARLFVDFIAGKEPVRFKTLVTEILRGKSFGKSFEETMPTGIAGSWASFRAHIQQL